MSIVVAPRGPEWGVAAALVAASAWASELPWWAVLPGASLMTVRVRIRVMRLRPRHG
ncbi:hypothetical protein [Streptomyces sp. NPDC013489]|uniref:hypothetical protein n=1 Tax=Streptomyces sp. NPDC013489 TaxID=3155606 RepID=UPI003405CF91